MRLYLGGDVSGGHIRELEGAFLELDFVRDVRHGGLPAPPTLGWTSCRKTPSGLLDSETYVYSAIVTIRSPVVLPENIVYAIKMERAGATA